MCLNPNDSRIFLSLLRSTIKTAVGEGEGGKIWENGIETCIISCMKWVASPGSMHDTGCLGLCTGTTQRDGMGREEGGGFRMGNTCIPVAGSFSYLAKLIQFVKFKNKIKFFKKRQKKKKERKKHETHRNLQYKT